MACATDLAETSALYAGFAASFRYPEETGGWLSGPEYIEAFDLAANSAATSLNEASYVDLDASVLFEELVRFYEHFGLRRQENAELPDHLAVELEFMHFLCELEQAAAARGEAVSAVNAAQRDFLDRHVLRLLNGVLSKFIDHEGKAALLVRECLEFLDAHRGTLAN
ncbi:MAG: molecular chaperone TorD family protein [Rhodocyclaceae bacterium]|nr:molecular chaperone TorD family protein [Rhodocyclaceae bacterium]